MNLLIGALLAATPSMDASLIGYTGLLNVPTAETRQDLGISVRWLDSPEPLLKFAGTTPVNRSYVVSTAFLPFLEGSLGLLQVVGWYDPQTPIWPYAVHRTLSAKIRAPIPWAGPQFAVGVVDPISANLLAFGEQLKTHYGLTNAYLAATQRLGPVLVSGGWGLGDTAVGKSGRTKPFLHGPFGGAAWALPGGLELMAEYDGITTNYGLRWASPWGLNVQGGYVGGGWSAGTAIGVRL